MAVIIRKARQSDVRRITALWIDFMDYHRAIDPHFTRCKTGHLRFADFASKQISCRKSLVLVAQTTGQIVGYLVAVITDYPPVFADRRYGAIWDLMVDRSARRKGIGKALVAEAMTWFRARRVDRIELSVAVRNRIGCRFWRSIGARPYMERRWISSEDF